MTIATQAFENMTLPSPPQTQSSNQLWLAKLLCFAIVVAAVFSGPLDIAEGTSGDLESRLAKGPSVLLKLTTAMFAGLVGCWGVVCIPRVRSVLTTPPGMILITISIIFLLTCITSVTNASLPIALVFVAYLLFVPTALIVLELRGTLGAVLVGACLFTIAALLLYVFAPRYGVFPEDMGDGVIIERLGGMSQPNHTARTALLGLLLTAYFIRLRRRLTWPYGLLFCLFSVAGTLAMSRTAVLATVICLGVLNLDWLWTRVGVLVGSMVAVLGIAAVFALAATGHEDLIARKLLVGLTKSGDIEEVRELTGRAEIWERTLLLIRGRPLQGYGMGSAKVMLIDHLQSTHNILLHPTLAAGVAAGGLTLLLLMWNLLNVFTNHQLVVRALSAYVLISGLTEDTIYETFPGACTLLWLVCCLWPAIQPAPLRNPT